MKLVDLRVDDYRNDVIHHISNELTNVNEWEFVECTAFIKENYRGGIFALKDETVILFYYDIEKQKVDKTTYICGHNN